MTSPAEGETPTTPVVVRDLVMDRAGKRILDHVSLWVDRAEIVGIMGMSGSGKTSILKCIAGLVKPNSGEILIEGADIVPLSEMALNRVRLRMGMVFQYAALFDSLTVYQNVAFGLQYGRRMRGPRVRDTVHGLLADLGLEGTEGLYPAQLSGGMQKRVGLARALAVEPAIILYDEPTSGLDPVIARQVDDLIVETRDRLGLASVVVSHDVPSVMRIAGRAAVVHEGRIRAMGTPAELRASDDALVRQFLGDVPAGGR